MRKITLSILTLFTALASYCGVPQAINYQAVALSGAGYPIKNRTVSLRLSILDGSSSGPIDYQERQITTTDNFGQINIEIGNGTVISGSFTGIDWSKGLYFVKTEMDTNAGTNYTNLGTVQFFSVPYSLYSAAAGQANLSSPEFPDGLNNITPLRLDATFNYIVPLGKTVYITQITHNGSTSCPDYGAVVDGIFMSSSASGGSSMGTGSSSSGTGTGTGGPQYIMDDPIVVPEGKAINSSYCGTSLVGFSVPKSYSWILFDLSTGNYTVPVGKVLVIKNLIPNSNSGWNGYYTVGGLTTSLNKNVSFADQGQTISVSNLNGSLLLMGYLKNR
jgi:hypothetical protein